nr:putative reverse transcriptase domain-containing protein [Tanacetum cinerariifolium]
MATSVISISSDSSEDSIGTPAGRVILFGTIPTTIPDTTPMIAPPTTDTPIIAPTIPPSPDYTPASPDYSPVSEAESNPFEDPSSGHIPPLPATSLFLSLDDDTTDSDTSDTPPSPNHNTPFTEITASTQRSPVIPCRRVMILAPGQPIPHGRPYHYHPNGPIYMMTARKRVKPLPVQQLSVRHSVDHSSSNSSSRHSSLDHSSPDVPSTSAGPSHKRHRSLMTSVPALPLVPRALYHVRADLIPSPKRVWDIGYLANVELELLSDYDYKIRYHQGNANMVVDALNRNERIKPLRVRALVMTIDLELPKQILNAQTKPRKPKNIKNKDVGEIVQETTGKIIQIKERIQSARDRQNSYADLNHMSMEFQVKDRVMLKVSPWKGIVPFCKRGKLNPRYVGPFKVLEKVGSIAYKLELPQELSRVHNTFHVSN